MRQIILDTETTGLNPQDGHRVIEIGCIEMVNRKITNNNFHVYLNPERSIDKGAVAVHGLTNEFLAEKPKFNDIYHDFLEFIGKDELVIHNAPFDIGFLDAELSRIVPTWQGLRHHVKITDTLAMAREKHPGQRNSLDALCKRYAVDNSERALHGALLDSEILAFVYLAMTQGQSAIHLELENNKLSVNEKQNIKSSIKKTHVQYASEEEIKEHNNFLNKLIK